MINYKAATERGNVRKKKIKKTEDRHETLSFPLTHAVETLQYVTLGTQARGNTSLSRDKYPLL